MTKKERTCPRCGATFRQHPALSRLDNKTYVCPDCGTREALESIGVEREEQDRILARIHEQQDDEVYTK